MLGASLRGGDFASLCFESLDFLLNGLGFLGIAPFGIPVQLLPILPLTPFGGSLEDKFGHVLLRWAFNASVGEVLDHSGAIVSDRTKVEGVSTWVKSKNHVKLLYKDRGWLMDGADDSLSGLGQFLEESDNRVGRLRAVKFQTVSIFLK